LVTLKRELLNSAKIDSKLYRAICRDDGPEMLWEKRLEAEKGK